MSDSNATSTPAEAPVKMYRNRTKVDQIVFPKGQWDKRIVPVGHTVCLTDAEYKRYFSLFVPADAPAPAKK